MKRSLRAAALAALALPALAGCANPSHASDAKDLRDQLAGLPGVEKVALDYTEPVTLDSGKLELTVTMGSDAKPEAIVDVVATAYDAFADAHHGEEGDLDVTVGDDTLHLRSFEPEAKVDAVKEASIRATEVFANGIVRADINTQDVNASPHVFTAYEVVGASSGAEALLASLADLEQQYADLPHASWAVQSGDGWRLSAADGFPEKKQLALFDDLRKDLPAGAVITLTDDDFPTVALPANTTPEDASLIVGRHLSLIGGASKAFYDVVVSGEDFTALYGSGDCTFGTGAVGVRLEQEQASGCKSVTHPAA